VTQQNAAMVEQSTAAAHGLRAEMQRLTELMGRFSFGAAAIARPEPGRVSWAA
jgi:methyl-accepting chemotaxis protein